MNKKYGYIIDEDNERFILIDYDKRKYKIIEWN